MSEQIAVRIPDALGDALDELVSSGRFATKAEAIRAALEAFVDAERRRRIGELIAEGYRRVPQSDAELDAATASAVRSIGEEPW